MYSSMTPPAYNGCTCVCHRHPGVMHCVPCCHPISPDVRRQPFIYLDLDGVFADFFTFARNVLGQEYHDTAPALAWGRLSLVPRLFRQLAVLPGSLEIYHALKHHGDRLQVLTATPLPTGFLLTAAKDKRRWVAKNISETLKVNTVTGGVNKYKLCQPGDVLIDDLARNLKPWEEAGGIGIHHTSVQDTLARLAELGLIPA